MSTKINFGRFCSVILRTSLSLMLTRNRENIRPFVCLKQLAGGKIIIFHHQFWLNILPTLTFENPVQEQHKKHLLNLFSKPVLRGRSVKFVFLRKYCRWRHLCRFNTMWCFLCVLLLTRFGQLNYLLMTYSRNL